MTQHNNGTDHPITYVSGLFRGSQLNWATLTKEAYAIYMSVKKLSFYIDTAKITVKSDHLPLKKFLEKNTLNSKVNNWAVELESQDITFEYIPGIWNTLADTLSRLIEMDENIKLQPEEEGKEFGYFPFKEFCIPLKSKHAEDIIKAYIDHICCTFGPSRKILTDNGTEFKNKLWTEVFEKLRTEQKFTPISSPQCNGRIEGFHKFLKATIAKQLETRVEWDDLVWKATAAYNFFPTELSGLAPFFLMFGCEAAVKHTLLESENPKYLGTNKGMINVGLMTKLYNVVAHNLNEARKARDGKKKGTTPKEPERLKIGDNILVRDHTSKAFQPKYKDFCIVGLLGKNQVEIKDNHGHITKVHRRDVKKIPMTEKVCKLYEEEQTGKIREGRKMVPNNKMPDLAWDIAETQLTQEAQKENNSNMTPPLQTLVTIIILITAIVKQTITQIRKIAKNTVQVIKSTTKEVSRNNAIRNIKDFHRAIRSAITVTTNTTDRTDHKKQAQINNKATRYSPGTRKPNDE